MSLTNFNHKQISVSVTPPVEQTITITFPSSVAKDFLDRFRDFRNERYAVSYWPGERVMQSILACLQSALKEEE